MRRSVCDTSQLSNHSINICSDSLAALKPGTGICSQLRTAKRSGTSARRPAVVKSALTGISWPRSGLADSCAAKAMAGQALHDEDLLAAMGWILRWYVWAERKLRPTLRRIGGPCKARNRVGPLFRCDARAFRMFPH